jgi:hypothetical protein
MISRIIKAEVSGINRSRRLRCSGVKYNEVNVLRYCTCVLFLRSQHVTK